MAVEAKHKSSSFLSYIWKQSNKTRNKNKKPPAIWVVYPIACIHFQALLTFDFMSQWDPGTLSFFPLSTNWEGVVVYFFPLSELIYELGKSR